MWCNGTQQAVIARLQSIVEYYEGLGNRGGEKSKALNSGSSSRKSSPRGPERECKRRE